MIQVVEVDPGGLLLVLGHDVGQLLGVLAGDVVRDLVDVADELVGAVLAPEHYAHGKDGAVLVGAVGLGVVQGEVYAADLGAALGDVVLDGGYPAARVAEDRLHVVVLDLEDERLGVVPGVAHVGELPQPGVLGLGAGGDAHGLVVGRHDAVVAAEDDGRVQPVAEVDGYVAGDRVLYRVDGP